MKATLITNSYIDIKNKLLNIENDYFKVLDAYIKNGFIFIKGILKSDIVGVFSGILLPDEYRPIVEMYGQVICNGSGGDNNKVQAFRIETNGNYFIWVNEPLDSTESFQFMFPLK